MSSMCLDENLQLLPGLRNRTRKESEFFGWSRIPNNTGSRIFVSDCDSENRIGSFFISHSVIENSC